MMHNKSMPVKPKNIILWVVSSFTLLFENHFLAGQRQFFISAFKSKRKMYPKTPDYREQHGIVAINPNVNPSNFKSQFILSVCEQHKIVTDCPCTYFLLGLDSHHSLLIISGNGICHLQNWDPGVPVLHFFYPSSRTGTISTVPMHEICQYWN